MKFSYKWLRELSKTTKSAQEVAEVLTAKSFEVEDVQVLGGGLEKVVVGKVLSKEQHPDADRLAVAQVDVGGDECLQIVCGAPNLAVNQKVPVALVGAKLPTKDGKGFEIKQSTIRGEVSNGMICAEDELGLGDDHEGIMVLADDAPVGADFAQYMGLDDTVLDIDILPNRGHDCLSHQGVAQEIAVIEGRTIIDDNVSNVTAKDRAQIDVTIATKQCARYMGAVVDNVAISASPQWMQARLRACGIAPINNIVDITNYVMLETGQPLHAFSVRDDRGVLWDDTVNIVVRTATEGEKLVLLDDTEVVLNSSDIVIANSQQLLALAGVMGGKRSGIVDSTTKIVVECANFDATTIRKTRIRHKIDSDAAYRFERELDSNLVARAMARALELIAQIAGSTVVSVHDIYPQPVESWEITLSSRQIDRLLGIKIAQDDTVQILENLGMTVHADHVDDGYELRVNVPTVRLDLRTPEDLIEEVGRIYGYDKIAPQPITATITPPQSNDVRKFEYVARDVCVAQGFDEIKSYSFYSSDDAQILGLGNVRHVEVLNPMNPDQAMMRQTSFAHLARAIRTNLTHRDFAQIFEVGKVYIAQESGLPQEKVVLGAAVASKKTDGTQFFVLKGLLDELCAHIGLHDYYFDDVITDDDHIVQLHGARRAIVRLSDGTAIGVVGELSRRAHKYFGIKNARCAIMEVDMEALRTYAAKERFFAPIPKFPSSTRDLSLVVGARTRVADVERVLYSAGGKIVSDIDLFDLYINKQTQERSMAFHIIFSAPDRTLTNKEVDAQIAQMISAVEEELGVFVKG